MRVNKSAGIAVVAALALAGCGGSSSGGSGSSSNKRAASDTLVLGAPRAPSGQDIIGVTPPGLNIFAQASYDTLVRQEADGSYGPDLATKWTYSADKKTLTLTLRSGVKFVDGTLADAAAAKTSLETAKTSSGPIATNFVVVNSITAVNPTTLTIVLNQSDPSFINALSTALIGSPTGEKKPDAKTKPYGSGPYILDAASTVPGSKYVYSKNPDYWDKSIQHYNKLVVNVYSTSPTVLNAIRGGQVQGVEIDDNTIVAQAKSAGYQLLSIETATNGLLFMDREGKATPALGNVKVRQAINQAVDRAQMLKVAAQGYGTPTAEVFGPSTQAYVPALDNRYPYDPAKARKLLTDAGYGNGLTLKIPQISGVSAAIWPLLKQNLKAIGITVNYEQIPANQTAAALLGGKYGVAVLPLAGTGTIVQDLKNFYLSAAPVNPFHVTNPTIDKLAVTISTGTSDEAAAAGKELNTYLSDQAIGAPWYRAKAFFAVDKNTTAQTQPALVYPVLWSFRPKS